MLFSCSGKKGGGEVNIETMITQQSDTLTMIYSKNGAKEYRFWTPLMERYEFARDPYMEFRYGINIITYDSLGSDASKLRADYAIFYEERELWETRGNVVGTGADGRQLFTQQLFWDQKTDKVYSNVDCKIVDNGDVFVGEGFESDSEFKDWVFRESEGRMWVDASQGEPTQKPQDDEENSNHHDATNSGDEKRREPLHNANRANAEPQQQDNRLRMGGTNNRNARALTPSQTMRQNKELPLRNPRKKNNATAE